MKHSTFERISIIAAPASALREWHFAEGAFEKLTPPWEKAEVIDSSGGILKDGARVVIDVGIGPLKQKWIAEHEITGDGFIDRQIEGPFAFWEHHHRFLPIDESSSQLIDSIHYRLPFGRLGNFFGDPFVRSKLSRMFDYRHEITRKELESQVDEA